MQNRVRDERVARLKSMNKKHIGKGCAAAAGTFEGYEGVYMFKGYKGYACVISSHRSSSRFLISALGGPVRHTTILSLYSIPACISVARTNTTENTPAFADFQVL